MTRSMMVLAALVVGCGDAAVDADPANADKTVDAENTGSNADTKVEAKSAMPDTKPKFTTDTPADVAAPPADALRTPSGLAYKVIQKGEGTEMPTDLSNVTVHYAGWTTDGKLFDSSIPREQPATFPLKGVIAGWTEGLQLMTVGEVTRFWIPEELAYKGQPGRPAGMLVFDVQLLSFKTPKVPKTPDDVAAPPADALRTASGLAYKALTEGTGDAPGPTSTVKVHYSGWTTDGKMFDSSAMRDQPAVFPLNRVIAGWTEGLQLMKTGGTTRFWIPVELAYNNQPGRPAGMLVFDVELLEVVKK